VFSCTTLRTKKHRQNWQPSPDGWNAWHSSSEMQHFSCMSLICWRTQPITRPMLSNFSSSQRPISSFSCRQHTHTHNVYSVVTQAAP